MVEVDRRPSPRVVEAEARARRCAHSSPHRSPAAASSAWRGLALAARARLELADLLERVDADLRVAADRQPHAGVAVAQRGQVAVAEVALRRRAGHDDRAGVGRAAATSRGGRRGCRGRRSCAGRGSPCGAAARSASSRARPRHSSSSRRCSWAWTWRTRPWRVGVGGDRLEPGAGHRADAVGGDADVDAGRDRPPTRAGRRRARGRRRRRVAEAPLARLGRAVARRPSRCGGRRRGCSTTVEARRRRAASRDGDGERVRARRTACRRAGGGRSGTRRRRRSRRPPSRRRRGAATSRIASGSSAPASPNIAVRQLQKSSWRVRRGGGRSPTPRRSRWNACECALTIAGIAVGPHRAAPRSAASSALAATAASSSDDRPPRASG